MQKNHGRFLVVFFELGVGNGKILSPNISPSFGPRSLKFFQPSELSGTHFNFEFQVPIANTGAWGNDQAPTHIFDPQLYEIG